MSGPLPKEAPVLPPLPESVNETFKILENNPVVKDALKQIKEEEQLTMADQIALTEIEAPPFHEEVRAAYFAERLRELGLTNVRIDKEGNVIGIRPGKRNGPRLVLGPSRYRLPCRNKRKSPTGRYEVLRARNLG